ncbi:beta-lactamase-like protein [Mycena leptocephala]|nr:beta-lactamase-like protein [Mycena leptocephala]
MQLIRMFSVLFFAIGGLACGQPHVHDEHEVVGRDSVRLKIAPGPSDPQIQFAPLPSAVDSVAIDPTLGYFVGNLGGGVYWVTDGSYNNMFMVSTHGVIVVDAPPTIGHKLLYAIGNTTRLPVTHLVYSHLHADHIGGALATLSPLDPLRPLPNVTFEGDYTLSVGNQTLELSYHGPNHAPGNLFMYAPAQRVAVLVDVIFPGWAPFTELGVADFVPGLIAAHDVLLRPARLVRVALNGDMTDAIGPTVAANPGNVWATPKALFRVAAQICADNTTSRWLGVLGAVDVFAFENAYRMVNSLLIEYDVPGPFSVA